MTQLAPILTPSTLRRARARLNLSQSQLAARLEVPLRTYQGWEIGRAIPYPAMLRLALKQLMTKT